MKAINSKMVRVGPRLVVIYDKNKDLLRFYVNGRSLGIKAATDYKNYLNSLNRGGEAEIGSLSK